jgi:poly(3-hydroxybutyrate) depolymerase
MVMRLGPGLLALILLLAVLGCGGQSEKALNPAEGPIGEGASGIWIYRPAGTPKDLVIYLHGQGGPTEATPEGHLPWIKHLVSRGSVVLYPRYEMDYEAEPMQFIANGIRTAAKRVDLDGLPVLVIGYSRGGGLAVEYGAVAGEEDLPVPNAIMGVFPAAFGNANQQVDLTPLSHMTEILFLVGDQDAVVGSAGAAQTGKRLEAAGFPGENVHLGLVESNGAFVADHAAPFEVSPAARAAFWDPADVILDALDEG